jgi:hypothetical protein
MDVAVNAMRRPSGETAMSPKLIPDGGADGGEWEALPIFPNAERW